MEPKLGKKGAAKRIAEQFSELHRTIKSQILAFLKQEKDSGTK